MRSSDVAESSATSRHLLRTPGGNIMRHPSGTDVFIYLKPVDALPAADES